MLQETIAPYFLLPGPDHLQLNLTPKYKMLNVFWIKLQVKGVLNNLVSSIGFQMSKIWCFQMALNTGEM